MALLFLAMAACQRDPGRLLVELQGPATADPLVFHGNCVAGWSVRATLRVYETGGADVRLDTLTYALRDEGHGEEIASESLDASSIVDRFGTSLVTAGGRLLFPLSGPFELRPAGPIVVSGELRGHDEHANPIAAPYRIEASALVVNEGDLGPGGACP